MAGKTAVTLRLGVEGDEKIQAALRQIGKTGDDAMQGLSREAKEAARAFDRLEKSVDAQARSAAQVARAYVQTNAAVAAGVRTQADAQRVLDLAAERHRRLTGAVNDNARATGLARHEWINLSRQFQDVGVSLAGGQAPLTVMLQQGSQIADIFGSSQAGAAGALRAFGAGAVRALASPIGVAAGLAAAILGVKAAGDAAAVSLAKLGEEARQTGLNPNRVVGAKIVGARAGLDEKETVGALSNAQKEFEAFSRNSGAVKDSLEKIDKGFLSVADQARNAGEWIDRIVQRIRELPRDQGLSLAKALFGDEGGRKLFDEIQRGAVSMASLSREAERAGANFDAAAEHAEKMKREIAEADRIASTRLLATFGGLADPVLAVEKAWANVKLGILDVERSARQLRDTLRVKAGDALGEQGEAASAVFGRMRGLRAFGGRDPFAGKTMADVDPLVNLFTQSDAKSRPTPVGETRRLFESTKQRKEPSRESEAFRYSETVKDLQARIELARAEGAEYERLERLHRIQNEQRRLGVKATQEQRDAVGALAGELYDTERAARVYNEAMQEAASIGRDVFGGMVRSLRDGQSAGEAFLSTLERIADRITDMALDAAFSGFGGRGKGAVSGGLLGGVISSLFGSGGGGGLTAPFAMGGVMTSAGPLPLRRYASGGIANSPQLAMFGEGRQPEAYVPLPDGRSIPVDMRGQSQNPVTVNVIGAPPGTQTRETTDQRGNRRVDVVIDERFAAAMGSPQAADAASANYGMQRRVAKR